MRNESHVQYLDISSSSHMGMLRECVQQLSMQTAYRDLIAVCKDGKYELNRMVLGLLFPQITDHSLIILPDFTVSELEQMTRGILSNIPKKKRCKSHDRGCEDAGRPTSTWHHDADSDGSEDLDPAEMVEVVTEESREEDSSVMNFNSFPRASFGPFPFPHSLSSSFQEISTIQQRRNSSQNETPKPTNSQPHVLNTIKSLSENSSRDGMRGQKRSAPPGLLPMNDKWRRIVPKVDVNSPTSSGVDDNGNTRERGQQVTQRRPTPRLIGHQLTNGLSTKPFNISAILTAKNLNNARPKESSKLKVSRKDGGSDQSYQAANSRHSRRKEANSKKRSQRCNMCEDCKTPDCMRCTACLDMRKYGGPQKLKQACRTRPKCQYMKDLILNQGRNRVSNSVDKSFNSKTATTVKKANRPPPPLHRADSTFAMLKSPVGLGQNGHVDTKEEKLDVSEESLPVGSERMDDEGSKEKSDIEVKSEDSEDDDDDDEGESDSKTTVHQNPRLSQDEETEDDEVEEIGDHSDDDERTSEDEDNE